jgi:hypothetical protein
MPNVPPNKNMYSATLPFNLVSIRSLNKHGGKRKWFQKTVFGPAFMKTRNSEEKAANLQSYYSFCKPTVTEWPLVNE